MRKIEAFGERLVNKYASLLPDDGKMFVDRMQNAAGRMRKLINDLLSYSRVTTDAKGFQQSVIGQSSDGSGFQIFRSALKRPRQWSNSVSLPTIECEAMQMRQLLQNLLGNALKFRKADVLPVIKVTSEIVETSDSPCGRTSCVADH